MGQAWIAENPRCPTHGQMSRVTELFRGQVGQAGWICWGYDGEGCTYTVGDDELDWQLLGPAEEIHFSPYRKS